MGTAGWGQQGEGAEAELEDDEEEPKGRFGVDRRYMELDLSVAEKRVQETDEAARVVAKVLGVHGVEEDGEPHAAASSPGDAVAAAEDPAALSA